MSDNFEKGKALPEKRRNLHIFEFDYPVIVKVFTFRYDWLFKDLGLVEIGIHGIKQKTLGRIDDR